MRKLRLRHCGQCSQDRTVPVLGCSGNDSSGHVRNPYNISLMFVQANKGWPITLKLLSWLTLRIASLISRCPESGMLMQPAGLGRTGRAELVFRNMDLGGDMGVGVSMPAGTLLPLFLWGEEDLLLHLLFWSLLSFQHFGNEPAPHSNWHSKWVLWEAIHPSIYNLQQIFLSSSLVLHTKFLLWYMR